MLKRIFVLSILIVGLALIYSKFSQNPLVGTWKVTDYQNNILIELPDAEQRGFESSVQLQRDKMLQLSEYTFNEDGSYHLQHSPTDFDSGQWLILNDSLMVQNSDIYKTSDTSIIHFNSTTKASITMSDFTQRVTVNIELVK